VHGVDMAGANELTQDTIKFLRRLDDRARASGASLEADEDARFGVATQLAEHYDSSEGPSKVLDLALKRLAD
jgi:hypothetical protein